MDDDGTRDDDSLLREIAAAPPVAIPQDLATFVLLEPGTVVDDSFRIDQRLGAGGMGVVYAARDLKLDREVALKLMRLDRGPTSEKLADVFEREARATARLNHPNIVTLHQFGNWNGLYYLVLERLRGETLYARMERGAITLAEGIAIMELVARALVHTHAAGITHRDLKPQNVFLLADGAAKVLDVGVSGLQRAAAPASLVAGARGSTLSLAGTPGYMAPEQWAGAVQDARTDMFAVGVMLYQLATGELPFGARIVEPGARAPSLAEKVPAEASDLVALVDACLQARMDDRLASAQELADRLHAIANAIRGNEVAGGSASGGLATARVRPKTRQRFTGAIVGAAAAALAIAGAALGLGGKKSDACAAAPRLAGVWDAATRARLDGKFGDTQTWSSARNVLTTYAGQWSSLAENACRAKRTAVTACLDQHLGSFAQLVGDAERIGAGATLSSARALPSLAECSDPDYIASIEHPDEPVSHDPNALVPFALSIAGRGRDIVHGLAFIDTDIVVAGFASTDANLAGTPLVGPPGDRFGFVARIGLDGHVRWVQTMDKAGGLSVATNGNSIAIGGAYNPGATIGKIALPSTRVPEDGSDGFVARLDAATGAVTWLRTIDAGKTSTVRAVGIDADSNVYAAGDTSSRATFGGSAELDIGAATEMAPYVAAWRADGGLRWLTSGRGMSVSKTWGIAVGGDSVVFTTFIRGSGRFGDRTLDDGGCVIGRLARDTGAIAWLHQDRGADNRCITDVVAIRGDRVAASGRHHFSQVGAWVAELALDDGSVRWIHPVGVAEHDTIKALAFAPDGTLYAAGHYTTETLAVGDKTVLSNGSWDGVVAHYDANGQVLGAYGFGGATSDLVRALAVGPHGEVIVGGRFETAMKVGDRTLRGRSAFDGYLVQLAPALFTGPQPPASSASP